MSIRSNDEFGRFLLAKEFFEYHPRIIQRTLQETHFREEVKTQHTPVEDYLVEFTSKPASYCVGCVDMVNSTKIASRLPQNQISSYYEVFLNSMSKIIGNFGGKVIKNIGDCLLYYFPDSLDSKEDGIRNCLECGLGMIDAQELISQKLKSRGLPSLNYRISSDYGSVIIMRTTESRAIDMIGPPVNMCSKINRCAEKNHFVIGGDLKEVIKKHQEYGFREIKGINIGLPQTYMVYDVTRREN